MKVNASSKAPDAALEAEVLGAPEGGTAIMTRQPEAIGRINGEQSAGNMKFPQLKIAYGVGALAEAFNQGDLVLDGSYLLAKRGEALIVTIASVSLYWKRYITNAERMAGVQPANYQTKQAAKDAGEIVDWPPRGSNSVQKPTVSPAGVYTLLIKKPEGLQCAHFGFEAGGALWAPARMFLDKKAHRVVIGEVQKAEGFSLASRKGGLLAGQFTLRTATIKKPDGNTETLPQIKFTGANSDDDVASMQKTFAAAAGTPDDDRE